MKDYLANGIWDGEKILYTTKTGDMSIGDFLRNGGLKHSDILEYTNLGHLELHVDNGDAGKSQFCHHMVGVEKIVRHTLKHPNLAYWVGEGKVCFRGVFRLPLDTTGTCHVCFVSVQNELPRPVVITAYPLKFLWV